MPKMKTHKGAAKRFRRTARGKWKFAHAYNNHYFERKSPAQKRRLERPAYVDSADRKRVERLLPYGEK
ncbi:MAG: 50S ribosomal protein L35 [Candidatus Poribacteria bacterium]|nr:MAG: 50S ribosomal protein L35 [Candidatus Poribacteria bacterium]